MLTTAETVIMQVWLDVFKWLLQEILNIWITDVYCFLWGYTLFSFSSPTCANWIKSYSQNAGRKTWEDTEIQRSDIMRKMDGSSEVNGSHRLPSRKSKWAIGSKNKGPSSGCPYRESEGPRPLQKEKQKQGSIAQWSKQPRETACAD